MLQKKESHVAFFSFPHTSHLNPTLPIVAVLARRGHRVTYVTSDRFAVRASEHGAEVVRCPDFDIKRFWEEETEGSEDLQHPYCRLALRTLSGVSSFYQHNKPALIIYDLVAFAGRIMANRMRIPAIKISPALAFDRQTFAADVRDVNFREELLNLGVKADRFLQRHGVPSEDFIFHRERLTINLFPKNFQPPGDVFGHNYFYAGRCPAEQRHYGEWRNERAEERPTALVATSSSYLRGADYFKMCMEAFDGLQWHVLLSIGDNADPNLLGPLPPHFEIVKNIAQVKILPYVNLAIFPGGLITSSEAAYHGVPLIAVTMGHSELEWLGDNIERLGIGIHLRKPNTSAMTIRKAVIDISRDHVFLKRVKEMQHKVRREFGAEEAVNRIEEMLEEG